jgi:hypothetical protein
VLKKMDSWALVWESWPHCRLNCNSYVSLPEGIMLCSDNLIIFDDWTRTTWTEPDQARFYIWNIWCNVVC